NLARHLGVDAEQALTGANRKFEERFREMERALAANGKAWSKLSLAEMEQEWRAAKRRISGA
ncbi:MAG: nucleoside triphosphate pyrophosphohydrolase, partial [Woeseiaceae bacterium]|nr:nucleoside triphosphate pyrophosphohydrolase [Woeseiaceae bacterium]